jgi:drug/metabolite transporter (DMT)-like permease
VGFKGWRDELLFVLLGLTGGSLYFLAENTAVNITTASSTVALIVCANPVLTAIVSRLVWCGEKLGNYFAVGSAIALTGMSLVVFNGIFVLDDNPVVFILSFASALCWSVYSIALRVAEQRYSSLEITRKVFFWGVVTMLPYFLYDPFNIDMMTLGKPEVIFNVVFLSLGASLGCYLLWNVVIRRIGIVVSSNYLYFNPVVALITAAIVLDETITMYAVAGCAITIIGVYLCNKKNKK